MIKRYKVFTNDPKLGNSAIIMDGDGMNQSAMQDMARKLDSPITVFILPPNEEKYDARFRFFTTKAEIGFCGHGILAASEALMKTTGGSELTIETQASIIRTIRHHSGVIQFEKSGRVDILDIPIDTVEISNIIGLPLQDLNLEHLLVVGSIGSPKLFVPVHSLNSLLTMRPNMEKISRWSAAQHVNGIYVYTFETKHPRSTVHARSFNPLFGVAEDAATGVAAGALGGLLATRGFSSPFVIEQGYILNAASEIIVDVETHCIRIGGGVVPVPQGITF